MSNKTLDDFIEKIANECVENMSDEDKEYISDHPCALDYHFGYCMYIRNKYLWNADLESMGIDAHPDDLSGSIMRRIISMLTDYDETDPYIYRLFEHESFASLRREYRHTYGKNPDEIIEKYREEYPDESSCYEYIRMMFGLHIHANESDPVEMEVHNRKESVIRKVISEIAEKVWKVDEVRARASECSIDKEVVDKRIDTVKKALFDDEEYIPMSYVFLLSGKEIGDDLYEECRKDICVELERNPWMMKKLDKSIFHDREIAKVVLKHSFAMEELPEYQNDDEMVKYALEHDIRSFQYIGEKYLDDRELVRNMIVKLERYTVMQFKNMERYRKDKEFVYLACRTNSLNYFYVDSKYRDDYELIKILLRLRKYHCLSEMSERLKDDMSLAIFQANTENPDWIMEFSECIRDSDELAEIIIKKHGISEDSLYGMSDRIKEKYGVKPKR